jgi:hypothetical protein
MVASEDIILEPTPPYFWPDLRTVMAEIEYSTPVPFQPSISDAQSVAGLISPVNHVGCEWLRTTIEGNSERQWNIVLAVYGGCHTSSRDLSDLNELQASFDNVNFRVKAFSIATAATTSMALVRDDGEITIAFGNSPNFGFEDENIHHLNVVLNPEAVLINQWRSWFDWIWENSAQLSEECVSIPALVPATGTPEAAAEWERYLDSLNKATSGGWAVDKETGELIPLDAEDKELTTITSKMGIPKADPAAIRISEVINKGSLITVDKGSRVPPLETPIPPEWFGDKAQIQQGLISRKTQVRISPFDDQTLKAIENKRKAVTSLIAKFSFPLADGVRWMPNDAIPLFNREIERANSEGVNLLQAEVLDGDLFVDVRGFLEQRRSQIQKNADDIFRQVTGSAHSSKSRIDDILERMEERLKKSISGNLLPRFSFSRIELKLTDKGDWNSPWGQAFSLTWHSAEFSRKIYSDPYFMRGLRVGKTEYANAMNVYDDWIVRDANKIRVDQAAEAEISILQTVRDSEASTQEKCLATLAIVDGHGEISALEALKSGTPK